MLPVALAAILAALEVVDAGERPHLACPLYPNAVVAFAAELHEGCVLEPGDAIIALEEPSRTVPIGSVASLYERLEAGEPASLVIRRVGEAGDRRISIVAAVTPVNTAAIYLAASALLAAILLTFVSITAARSGVPAAMPFAAIHSCMGVLIVAAVGGWTSASSYPLTALARAVLPAALIHLAFVFPRMREVAVRVPGVHRVTYGVALGLFVLELDTTYRGAPSTMLLLQRIEMSSTGIAVLLLCFSSWLSIRESPSRLERGQARVFLTGLALLLAAAAGGLLVDVKGASLASVTLAAALSPLPLGYAIARYHLFDFGTALRRVVAQVLYLSIWSGLFFVGVMAVRSRLPLPDWLRHPVVIFAAVYAVLAPLDGLRQLLKRFIERAFQPEARIWARLSEGRAARIAHLRDPESIGREAVALALEGVPNASASFFSAPAGSLRLVHAAGPEACEDAALAAVAVSLAGGADVVDLNRVDTVAPEAAAVYEAGVEIVSVISSGDTKLAVMLVCPQKRGRLQPSASLTWLRLIGVHTAAALENARLTEQLREAEKFAIRGRMHAALAHEIGKPLGALEHQAQRLVGDSGAEPGVRERASSIVRIAGQLRDIVRGVLDVGRGGEGVEVSELIERACLEVSVIHGDGAVSVRPLPALPPLERGAERAQRALTNLLDNAIRASAAGDTVEISARAMDGAVEIEVADRGCGLAPEDTERVFEAFVSLRPGGHGLGLTISRQIVEQLGGTLALDSALGRGTIARLRLPAAPAADDA